MIPLGGFKSLKEAEKHFHLKVEQPFFASDGFSLTAVNGFESPQVVLKALDGTEVQLNRHSIVAFSRAFSKARDWCDDGWTDGMC